LKKYTKTCESLTTVETKFFTLPIISFVYKISFTVNLNRNEIPNLKIKKTYFSTHLWLPGHLLSIGGWRCCPCSGFHTNEILWTLFPRPPFCLFITHLIHHDTIKVADCKLRSSCLRFWLFLDHKTGQIMNMNKLWINYYLINNDRNIIK